MKAFNIILSIVSALLAIVGVFYLVLTFGDKIVDWFKNLTKKSKPVYSNKRDFDSENNDDIVDAEDIVDADDTVEAEFAD